MNEWLLFLLGAGIVLLAVLVGAALPALFEFRTTMRAHRDLLERLGPKIDATLREVQETSVRINRAGALLEQGAGRAEQLFSTIGELSDSLQRLRSSLGTAAAVGSAIGPAVAAALRALTSNGEPRTDDETDAAAPAPEASAEPGERKGEVR